MIPVTHQIPQWNDLNYGRLLITSLALFTKVPHEIVVIDGKPGDKYDVACWLRDIEPHYREMNPHLQQIRCFPYDPKMSGFAPDPDIYRLSNQGLIHGEGEVLFMWGVDEVAGHPGFDVPLYNHAREEKRVITPTVFSPGPSKPEAQRRWLRITTYPEIGTWASGDWNHRYQSSRIFFHEAKMELEKCGTGIVENQINWVPFCTRLREFRDLGGYFLKDGLGYPESLDVYTMEDRLRPQGYTMAEVLESVVFHFVGSHLREAGRIHDGGPPSIPDLGGLDDSMIDAAEKVWG